MLYMMCPVEENEIITKNSKKIIFITTIILHIMMSTLENKTIHKYI